MATVVITDEAELQAFLASGKKGDEPAVADPELGTVAWSEEKGRWERTAAPVAGAFLVEARLAAGSAYPATTHRAPDPRTGFRDDPSGPGARYLSVPRPGYLERRVAWCREAGETATGFFVVCTTENGRYHRCGYCLSDMEVASTGDFRSLAERLLREFRGELTAGTVGRMLADAFPDKAGTLLDGEWAAFARGYDAGRADRTQEARQEERRSVADGLERWAVRARSEPKAAAAVRLVAMILRDHDERLDGPLAASLARCGVRDADLWKPGEPGYRAGRFG